MDVPSQEPSIERKVIKTEECVTTCAHSCPHHGKLMDVALWSGLSEELQELVFARLPWPQIYGVRILSKGWNQKLMSGARDSQLRRACARAQPKSFALLARGARGPGLLVVNMFDLASNRWHTFETSLGYDPQCGENQVVIVSYGGLVCFLSKAQFTSEKTPRLVFVCNPLTRVWKQLPPLYGIVQQQKIMMQLIMDRETKHYRVIVVGYCKNPKVGNLVNVYHSEIGQWIKVDGSSSGEVVYGYLYNFNSFGFGPAPCSYNFADGLVHEIVTNFPGNYAHQSILVKDHLFCLKYVRLPSRLPTGCIIEEYQAVHCGASWTPLKEYPLNRPPRTQHNMSWSTEFFASKDFLLLSMLNLLREENVCEFLWLYEFSGEGWRELPMMPEGGEFFCLEAQICELRFDSVP